MKRIIPMLLLLIILCVFVGCSDVPFRYTMRQNVDNIEKVEICFFDYYNDKKMEVLAQLSSENVDLLISDIATLECYEFFAMDPILTYGDVVICIRYLDGETEVIGITNIGFVSPDGKWSTSRKRFEIKAICAEISKFVDPKILAEVSDYFD